ncbi:MAG: ArnT family glycosyltransferase [Aggregatilineales bacterium]
MRYLKGHRLFPPAPWVILSALLAYQAMLYSGVARAYQHVSVVLLPWLMAEHGFQLYKDINLGHAPGYLWFNALLYRLVPDHTLRLRLFTVLIATAITLMVYRLGRRWWGQRAGLVAAALAAAWGPVVLQYLLYFEFALGLLAISALAAWHRLDEAAWRQLAAGSLVGLMILIKPQMIAVGGVFLVWRLIGGEWRRTTADLLRFSAGVALPLVGAAFVLLAQGTLERAIFYTTIYNRYAVDMAARWPSLDDLPVVALWMLMVPLYCVSVARRCEPHSLLLLGLLVALCLPAFPIYGLFHLSGALPMVALAAAGGLSWALTQSARRARTIVCAAFALTLITGLALPFYYRLRLGPTFEQYDALLPVVDWVKHKTGADPGTRLWILPDIDPTGNFYLLGGYLPPQFYTNTYPWYLAWPQTTAQYLANLDADPPAYLVLVEKWRYQLPAAVMAYAEAHYQPLATADMPYGLDSVTLAARLP